MLFLKKLGKSFVYLLSSMLILTLIMTFFNFIGIIGPKFLNILKIIVPLISLLIGGFIIGKSSIKKAWLEGIKYGSIVILFIVLLNYFGFQNSFKLKHLLLYFAFFISYIFGSMIGMTKKVSD